MKEHEHSKEFVRVHSPILTKPFYFFLALSLVGVYFIILRFVKGIGAVSNLSDGYPWGIWIAYDVATGTAIACGGYAVAILVYIRNRWQYHPLIRSAILTSLFGYCLAGFSVMVDIGRPWNAYGFFMPSRWQPNSAMFEVALCIMGYCVVQIIEFFPSLLCVLEHSKLKWLQKAIYHFHPRHTPQDEALVRTTVEWVHSATAWFHPKFNNILIFIVALGLVLPTMHQSSLGSLMLIAPTKLHPLWHTGFLPLLFLINCMYMGYAIVILESLVSSYLLKREYEVDELSGLAHIIPWLAAVWLSVRLGDLIQRDQVALIFKGDKYSLFFLLEFLLLAGGSLLLFDSKRWRSPRWLFATAAMMLLGGALYRFNVYLIGFIPGTGWRYFPSFAELMISVGIVSIEILGYQVLIKFLPVLPNPHMHRDIAHVKPPKAAPAVARA
ncbi:Ni/Fe-hydrogenase cytochrome b subunit [Oryzomonas japonica]|uniref:Ni/Fe-hydrogenase cytochrome b subunit n=1 Tax=Oryzomonas japonica TaxID=2603858 RepID=A0A7J4ZNK7_9BACT|nr:Ni/Fe-hydrogenase cytochrome b subunit [Oryzomonas japonica]KAB0664289.1 Ni/Fe-hydrogenase cytochrome b subunit [Oryzomonas japonica]